MLLPFPLLLSLFPPRGISLLLRFQRLLRLECLGLVQLTHSHPDDSNTVKRENGLEQNYLFIAFLSLSPTLKGTTSSSFFFFKDIPGTSSSSSVSSSSSEESSALALSCQGEAAFFRLSRVVMETLAPPMSLTCVKPGRKVANMHKNFSPLFERHHC